MTELTPEYEAEIRSKINPYYAVQKGTESYERRVLLDEIGRLRALIKKLEYELKISNVAIRVKHE